MRDLLFTVRHRRHVVREQWIAAVADRLPRALRRAVIVGAAVNYTRTLPRDAYAGPDGIDFRRLWDHA